MIYPYREEKRIKYDIGIALVPFNSVVNMSKSYNIWRYKL